MRAATCVAVQELTSASIQIFKQSNQNKENIFVYEVELMTKCFAWYQPIDWQFN